MPFLLVSGAGVVIALLIWATRGWVDALAVYVVTIAALGLMLVRMTRRWPHGRSGRTADLTQIASTHVDSTTTARANTGLSVSDPMSRAESGLHRTHG